MTKLLLLAATLGACAVQPPTTPLNQLNSTTIAIVASSDQVNVELKVIGSECPTLGDEVRATFDGVPMEIARGGYAGTFDGCYPIAFTIAQGRMSGVATYEAGSSNTDLLIEDKTTRWTIASTRLFTNQFDIDTAGARIVWQNVDAITTAQLQPVVPLQIEGNVIHYPPGTDVQSVIASAHPIPTKCDGPGLCLVNLQGAHAFQSTPP